MGFRFRKSFKLIPGVRVNLSKGGISTTLGGSGASVNIGKRGTHLNVGIPGTGISSRSRIGGNNGQARYAATPSVPQTPQPASTRVFSFGVAIAALGVFTCITALLNPTASPKANPVQGIAFWSIFGVGWWFIRKQLRASKQRKYEAYIQNQAEEASALQLQIAEDIHRRQLASEQEAIEHQQDVEEKEQQRRDSFEPQLSRGRALVRDGLATEQELAAWEESTTKSWMVPSILAASIDAVEKIARAETSRKTIIYSKYDTITAAKLILRQIEPGMSREEVIDSLGETTNTEHVLTKGGERETLIYGSKTSGSYFHIVGGIVTKAVVR